MHDQTITFIVAGGEAPNLLPLTLNHPKVLVPFGGVFRILDFALSNVINSQLRNVYVLTQDKEQQVQSYIGEGWPQLSRGPRWRAACPGASSTAPTAHRRFPHSPAMR